MLHLNSEFTFVLGCWVAYLVVDLQVQSQGEALNSNPKLIRAWEFRWRDLGLHRFLDSRLRLGLEDFRSPKLISGTFNIGIPFFVGGSGSP